MLFLDKLPELQRAARRQPIERTRRGRPRQTSRHLSRTVHAGCGDEPLLLRWANSGEGQAVSLTRRGPIGWTEHRDWLERRLGEPKTAMLIALCDGAPAGEIRAETEPMGRAVSIFVEEAYRGRGIGRAMIGALRERSGAPLIARVRHDNPRSQAFFESLGFRCVAGEANHVLFADHGQA